MKIDNIEVHYLLNQLTKHCDVIRKLHVGMDPAFVEGAVKTIGVMRDLLEVLERGIGWPLKPDVLAKKYPQFSFTYDKENDTTLVTHLPYEFERAQAELWRDRLAADGVHNFRVAYKGNGYVPQLRDEIDYLQELQRWLTSYTVWKDPGLDRFRLKLKDKTVVLDETTARIIASDIQTRFPAINVVVFYGENNAMKIVV